MQKSVHDFSPSSVLVSHRPHFSVLHLKQPNRIEDLSNIITKSVDKILEDLLNKVRDGTVC